MSQPDISNLARRLAEQNNVAWQSLKGTGPDGRVVERDVLDYLARVMAGEEAVDPTPEPLPEGMEAWTEVGADSVGNYSRAVTPQESVSSGASGGEVAAEAAAQVAELGDDVFLFDDDDDDVEAPAGFGAGGTEDGGDVRVEQDGFPSEPISVHDEGLVTPDLDDDLLLVSDDDLDEGAPGDEPSIPVGEVPGDSPFATAGAEADETAEPSEALHDYSDGGAQVDAPEEPAPAWGGSELRLDSEPYEPVPLDAPDLWEDGEVQDGSSVGAAMFEPGGSVAAQEPAPAGSELSGEQLGTDVSVPSAEVSEFEAHMPSAEVSESEDHVPSAEVFEAEDPAPSAASFEPDDPATAPETLEAGEFSAAGTAAAGDEGPYGTTGVGEPWSEPLDQTEVETFDELGVGEADLDAREQVAPALPLVHTPNLLRRNVDLSALAAAQLAAGLELGQDGPLSVAPFLVRAAAKAAHDVGLTGGEVALAEIQAGIMLRRVDGAASMAFVELVRELEGAGMEEDEVALVAVDLSMLDVDEAFLDVGAPSVTLGRILYDSEVGGYRSTLALTGSLPLDQGARLLARVAELLTSPVRLLV